MKILEHYEYLINLLDKMITLRDKDLYHSKQEIFDRDYKRDYPSEFDLDEYDYLIDILQQKMYQYKINTMRNH